MNRFRSSFVLFALVSVKLFASALPPNQLDAFDSKVTIANISEEQFGDLVDSIVDAWKPYAKLQGATLSANKDWESSIVNASAGQIGTKWSVNFYGALARRSEITPDGFSFVICHELGHHFAGHYFFALRNMSVEGQADYFAAQACLRKVWESEHAENEKSANLAPEFLKKTCDEQWRETDQRNLCYRVSLAAQSFANLAAVGSKTALPKFETPDKKVLKKTFEKHPQAQCRLDTALNAALCGVEFDLKIRPGLGAKGGNNSAEAERIAADYSCMAAKGQARGSRPACWFAPQVTF